MVAIFPASSKEDGICLGFPDACWVPLIPVPVPLPSLGMLMQFKKARSKVKFQKKKAVVKGNKAKRCAGDEAGLNGGMITGANMKEVALKMATSKVKAEGKKVCHLTSMSVHNGGSPPNMPAGLQVAPSQTKVLVAP